MSISRNREVAADRFAVAFGEMLKEIEDGLDASLLPAVRAGCRSAKTTVQNTALGFWAGSGYPSGFSYKTEKRGKGIAEGEVGHPTKPGLVHLLEKGHATIGGMYGGAGRTRAFPHVAPGADEGEKVFYQKLLEGVDNAL